MSTQPNGNQSDRIADLENRVERLAAQSRQIIARDARPAGPQQVRLAITAKHTDDGDATYPTPPGAWAFWIKFVDATFDPASDAPSPVLENRTAEPKVKCFSIGRKFLAEGTLIEVAWINNAWWAVSNEGLGWGWVYWGGSTLTGTVDMTSGSAGDADEAMCVYNHGAGTLTVGPRGSTWLTFGSAYGWTNGAALAFASSHPFPGIGTAFQFTSGLLSSPTANETALAGVINDNALLAGGNWNNLKTWFANEVKFAEGVQISLGGTADIIRVPPFLTCGLGSNQVFFNGSLQGVIEVGPGPTATVGMGVDFLSSTTNNAVDLQFCAVCVDRGPF